LLNCREFDASVLILHHSTTICRGYQPLIHCGVLRQSAEIIDIRDHESLKTGESKNIYTVVLSCTCRYNIIQNSNNMSYYTGAEIRFRFVYFAEMILPGDVFLFREGRAKGINCVIMSLTVYLIYFEYNIFIRHSYCCDRYWKGSSTLLCWR
jgi:GTPase